MDSAAWLAWFRANRSRKTPEIPARIDDLPAWMRAPLVASLQRFQIGETGEGTVATQLAASSDPAIDETVVECVRLWIREEGRHARELADLLRALDAEPLRRDVSQWLFKTARRALGVRTKLATIFVAEVVGLVFYGLVRDRVPSRAIRDLAGALHDDERAHLDFLVALLRTMIATRASWARPMIAAQLAVTTAAALLGAVVTLSIDQRACLAVLGSGGVSFGASCMGATFDALRASHSGSAPFAASARTAGIPAAA